MGQECRNVRWIERDQFVVCVPGIDGAHVLEHELTIEAGIVGFEEAKRGQPLVDGVRIVLEGGANHGEFGISPGARDTLGHPEVEEGDSPVTEQPEVARMGVA